jgi:hypothetical protein
MNTEARRLMMADPNPIPAANEWAQTSLRLTSELDLPTQPVGVWLIRPADDLTPFAEFDATVVPYQEQRLNFSLGCYGCREATDLGPDETVLGFPAAHLDALVEALERLRANAIPRSRAKKPYEAFVRARASACQTSDTSLAVTPDPAHPATKES